MIPTSRTEFKEYCLRRLGKPVINIEMDDEQIEDRIDDALQYYWEYHFDGTERIYAKHPLTQDNISNSYIDVPTNILGVSNIFPVTASTITNSLFSFQYQFALQNLANLVNINTAEYVRTFQQIELIENIFGQRIPYRYNRRTNRLYLDADLETFVSEGDYIVLDVLVALNTNYNGLWGDRWLQRYATAMLKKQWGENLKKFEGVKIVGGVSFNGQKIWDEATEEIKMLEDDMALSYSLPNQVLIG